MCSSGFLSYQGLSRLLCVKWFSASFGTSGVGLGVNELGDVVALDQVRVVLNELFNATSEEVSVLVASVDHGARSSHSIPLIAHIHYYLLPLLVLEPVHLRNRLVLIYHHEGHAVRLFYVPSDILRLVTEVNYEVA